MVLNHWKLIICAQSCSSNEELFVSQTMNMFKPMSMYQDEFDLIGLLFMRSS